MIAGVQSKSLKLIPDERGRLMEILRADEEIFQKFGQVYMTTARPGIVKAWHWHQRQSDYFACVHGTIKLVLHDNREGSPSRGETNEFLLGDAHPLLVQIPPFVYHGFQCVSGVEAIVINVPTEPYDHKHPDEYRLPPDDPSVPYNWKA